MIILEPKTFAANENAANGELSPILVSQNLTRRTRKRGKRPIGDSGDTGGKIGSDYSTVSQITKERPKRRYHQPSPHRTQLTCVTQNESGDVRCPYHGEVWNYVVKSIGQELLRDGHVVEQR